MRQLVTVSPWFFLAWKQALPASKRKKLFLVALRRFSVSNSLAHCSTLWPEFFEVAIPKHHDNKTADMEFLIGFEALPGKGIPHR
jgi:hypothetical protein